MPVLVPQRGFRSLRAIAHAHPYTCFIGTRRTNFTGEQTRCFVGMY